MPFSDVIGHARLVELLRHACARDRVPQSLIFAGPEGIGKRVVATALAQAVNCPRRKDGDGCGTCATCRRIARAPAFGCDLGREGRRGVHQDQDAPRTRARFDWLSAIRGAPPRLS